MDAVLNPLAVKLGCRNEIRAEPKTGVIEKIGRGEWIRTTDLLVPNQAL